MTRIDEIRDRLDKATPGRWEWEPPSNDAWPQSDQSLRAIRGPGDWDLVLAGWGYDACGIDSEEADRDLIANAPADLAWCLDKLDAIRAVLGDEPDPCPEHPDDDPVTCGWKRDIIDIRRILNDTKEN